METKDEETSLHCKEDEEDLYSEGDHSEYYINIDCANECYNYSPIVRKGCSSCEEGMCQKCMEESKTYNLAGRITTGNKCTGCGGVVCRHCVRVCYECASSPMMCKKCSVYVKVDCPYHIWYVCENHVKDAKCGEC